MDVNRYFQLLLNGKIDEANKVRHESIPGKLIKFVSLSEEDSKGNESKLESLKSGSIWISDISHVNDPYEFKGLYLKKQEMREAGFSDKDIDYYEELFDLTKEFGISCLSANSIDYLPMWAYYANNHDGFVIEYDVVKKDALYEVQYEPKRVGLAKLILEMFKETKKAIHKDGVPGAYLQGLMNIFMLILYMKSDTWKHEKEYRIIYPLPKNLMKPGVNVPIYKLGLKVNRVVCGVNCSDDNFSKINDICKSLGLEKANKSQISQTKYGLEF